jgi:FkbM family methyltransferase
MKALILNESLALVTGRDGMFLVNRKDFFIGKALEIYGEYNGTEAAFLRHLIKPGDTVIEVGANIGSHTIGLAKAVGPAGKVFAFEPQRPCYALLQAQIALNQISNIYSYNVGLGQAREKLWVPHVDYAQLGNFGGVALKRESEADSEPVDVVTLDEQLEGVACSLIKIDVEGMEEPVIRGALKLITKTRPTLYVENDRLEKSKSLVTLIFELGYRIWWHIPPLFSPTNFFNVPQNIYGNVASFNMVCCDQVHAAVAQLPEIKSINDPHPAAGPNSNI